MAMTLDEVNTKIEALLNGQQVDYEIGDKSVKASQKLDQLLKYREHLLKNPAPDVATMHMDFGTNEFGEETGQFED